MTFSEGFRKGGDRARRGGGGIGRGGIAVGGGLGGIVLVGLYLLLGGDPGALMQGGGPAAPQQGTHAEQGGLDHCETGADANEHVDCRIEFTGISLDRVWSEQLPAQAGIEYTAPGIVIFDGRTQSACGPATANTGPFYCPGDESSYYDVSFFEQLERLGGGSGPLSQEYVVAHEFGHHIQKLEGTLHLSDYNDPGADSGAVRIELQADCYAGIWAHFADDGPDAILEPLTEQQVRDAMATARAIGDDAIQSHSGGGVNPDLWTHGSSEQRENAFLTGYRTGSMAKCDTLGRDVYSG
ncbi:KPN_02809 family neutral zinc metallopeptidase [Corynebacterium sp. 335C]